MTDIIKQIIKREGGYVNHPADRGGPTKYGITLETLENWFGSACTADDVQALSKDTASEIYRSRYYSQPGIYKLPPSMQDFMLDAAVHHGPVAAIKLLQETMLRNGTNTGRIDGIIGPKTEAAASRSMDEHGSRFIDQLVNTRIGFVERIVKHDETQRVFLPGWIARIESLKPEPAA